MKMLPTGDALAFLSFFLLIMLILCVQAKHAMEMLLTGDALSPQQVCTD
jgi:hypothetical protein